MGKLTEKDLEEIIARAKASTDGGIEWNWETDDFTDGCVWSWVESKSKGSINLAEAENAIQADKEFFEHARSDILLMSEELNRVWEENQQLRLRLSILELGAAF